MPHRRGPYNLYLWDRPHGLALQQRGHLVFTTDRWAKLKAEAERRAVAAGYPKSRWMELFDWNKGSSK